MSLSQVRDLLRSWSERDEDDLLFWWVVKYTEPDEAEDVVATLPRDVRARFTRWLEDKQPGAAWIDRLGIFDRPEDIDLRLHGLADALSRWSDP